jgi:hypothetical protein
VNTWTGIKEAFNNYKNQVKEAKDTQQQAKDKKNQAQQNTEQLVKEKIVLTDQEKQNILLDKGVAYTTSFDNELYVAYADSLDYVVEVYRQMEQNRQARDYSSDLSIFNTIITEIKKVEEEIGKQPNDEGTLRKSIKEICEHQCSNV